MMTFVMSETRHNPWLTAYAVLTAAAAWCLIWIGGLVTSHGAGLAVPDWPTTYGYNMFFFPISKWRGGIFYEHTHRLFASMVGLMTVVLAVWLWAAEGRRWLRWLGVLAVFAVVLQGVLGGLRVTALKDEIGIFHAALAQTFLVLVSAIALFCSRWWRSAAFEGPPDQLAGAPLRVYVLTTGLIFLQLALGAVMRHQHAGLAIPDFPLAHGTIWPAMDADSIVRYNQLRSEATALKPITAAGVALQMAHRITALGILAAIAIAAWFTLRRLGPAQLLAKLTCAWLALIVCQVLLGAATVWTGKSADITTAHVAVGALCLVLGALTSGVTIRLGHRSTVGPGQAEQGKAGALPQSATA
jgi:cytochrome c oxidase assembly protein subunit 15